MTSTGLKRSPPLSGPPLTDKEAADRVQGASWYHTFELRPGLVTPGVSVMDAVIACDGLGIPHDLKGKRALDVGAWDGAITFELEKRGAEAHALDIQDPSRIGFNAAREVMNSQAVHYEGSVYQLPTEELTDLDLIVFRGVFYHLKYPVLAFERLAASLKLGGILYFEGEGLIQYAEDLNGNRVDIDIRKLNESGVPFCLSYPNSYRMASNWFIPNRHCLNGWLQAAGFELIAMHEYDEGDGQRLYGSARKVREGELLEHPLY
jgi:tRNA (mo5U34)-methyltransferase